MERTIRLPAGSIALMIRHLTLLSLLIPAALWAGSPGEDFFEKKIRPVFLENCVGCHGPKKQSAELRLDLKAAFLKGSDNGPVVVSGNPDKSSLIRAVRHEGEVKMPPKGKLPDAVVADLVAWVKMGVPWPEMVANPVPLSIAEVRKRHWAFQPVRNVAVPPAKSDVRNPIDAFVLHAPRASEIGLSPEADRRTLVRRITFDLTGLPPTPAEIESAESDRSPDWYERVTERLLASPAYGERWGRHWLDVARYADTKGYLFEEERRYPFAWTYRDYVVRAFNGDLPYDRFILHQLAADRLDLKDDRTPLAAMGYLTLGRRFLNNVHDIIDDRIDVTMRGFQGLTVTCARCHDHKFDPVPSRDYYSLHGVFASSVEPKDLPVIGASTSPESGDYQQKLTKLEQDVEEYRKKHEKELKEKNRKFESELRDLRKKVDALRATHPGAPPGAMVLNDGPLSQPYVFLRGNPGNRGETVPRRWLEVLSDAKREPFRDGSGRLELARAIAAKDNPLTARVMVNRLWMHHFGAGLVRTPSDFGLRGEPPTHPELLDWLARRFMDDGWSIKSLHRLIVTSATYRQSSDERPELKQSDPENRLLLRMNRRRLDFEQMRDGMLAVSGRLDRTMGGPAVDITKSPSPPRRSIHAFIDRQNLPGVFRTFDLAGPDAHVPQRHSTTVPQQALFLLNNPFVVEQAKALAARTEGATKEARIDRMHRLLFGRGPDREETAMGMAFLAEDVPSAWVRYAQVLLLANEFAFVD